MTPLVFTIWYWIIVIAIELCIVIRYLRKLPAFTAYVMATFAFLLGWITLIGLQGADPATQANVAVAIGTILLALFAFVSMSESRAASARSSDQSEKSIKAAMDLVTETQRQAELEASPDVHIGTRWFGVTLMPFTINVGRSPVLDLRVEVSATMKESYVGESVRPASIKAKLLLPGERIRFMVPDLRWREMDARYRNISMRGTCRGIDGKEHIVEDQLIIETPEQKANPENEIYELLPDDEALEKIKRAIEKAGDKVSDKINDVSKSIDEIGPVSIVYCPKCGGIERIDVKDLELKCNRCGGDLKVR